MIMQTFSFVSVEKQVKVSDQVREIIYTNYESMYHFFDKLDVNILSYFLVTQSLLCDSY